MAFVFGGCLEDRGEEYHAYYLYKLSESKCAESCLDSVVFGGHRDVRGRGFCCIVLTCNRYAHQRASPRVLGETA